MPGQHRLDAAGEWTPDELLVAEMTALGRAGEPDDIGPMLAALLSDENRWINGQRIEVSGGMAL